MKNGFITKIIAYVGVFSMMLGLVGCATKETTTEPNVTILVNDETSNTLAEEETSSRVIMNGIGPRPNETTVSNDASNITEESNEDYTNNVETTTTKKPSGNSGGNNSSTTKKPTGNNSEATTSREVLYGPDGKDYYVDTQYDEYEAAWKKYYEEQEVETDDTYRTEIEIDYIDNYDINIGIVEYPYYKECTYRNDELWHTKRYVPENKKVLVTLTLNNGTQLEYYKECNDNGTPAHVEDGGLVYATYCNEYEYDYVWTVTDDWTQGVLNNDYYSLMYGGDESKYYVAVCYAERYGVFNLADGTKYRAEAYSESYCSVAIAMEIRDLSSIGYTEYNATIWYNVADNDDNGAEILNPWIWNITEDKGNKIIDQGVKEGILDKEVVDMIKSIHSSSSVKTENGYGMSDYAYDEHKENRLRKKVYNDGKIEYEDVIYCGYVYDILEHRDGADHSISVEYTYTKGNLPEDICKGHYMNFERDHQTGGDVCRFGTWTVIYVYEIQDRLGHTVSYIYSERKITYEEYLEKCDQYWKGNS